MECILEEFSKGGREGRGKRDNRDRGGKDMQRSATESTRRLALCEQQLTNRTYQYQPKAETTYHI